MQTYEALKYTATMTVSTVKLRIQSFKLRYFPFQSFSLFFFFPMSPHVLVDFVVLPPGRGRSVTDF